MFNVTSKKGIGEILWFLDDTTLQSLATTVTQGLLKNRINSREDAANAIVNYSPDALSILRRKVITREVLFSYLHNKNVPISLPATKTDLVQKIASLWEIQYTQEAANIAAANTVDDAFISAFAKQFTSWFYTMLNKNEMNSEHFYQNAKLQINIINIGECSNDVVECDPQQIAQRLLLLKVNYNLFFNPNLSDSGVKGRVDPHGLVLVLVCGTLHVQGTCVGVFEQVFGLLRDPQAQNNWRIRMTDLVMKSDSGITQPPTLESCSWKALT